MGKPSSSSSGSGSLKIINLNEMDWMLHESKHTKDLFEILLDEDSNHTYLPLKMQSHSEDALKTIENMNLSPRQNLFNQQHSSHQHTSNQQHSSNQQQGCKCTKIDCLKLYCECFAKGKSCNSSCICVCCKNCE